MQVRSGSMQPSPEPDPAGRRPDQALPDPVAGRELSWRVTPGSTVLKWVGAGIFGVVALGTLVAGGDLVAVTVALAGALLLALLALRDVLAPVRLAADPAGLTVVSGYAGRRRIPWAAVERIHVDERTRFGARTRLLEIDTGETLHLFSAAELGVGCDEVAAALAALRTGG